MDPQPFPEGLLKVGKPSCLESVRLKLPSRSGAGEPLPLGSLWDAFRMAEGCCLNAYVYWSWHRETPALWLCFLQLRLVLGAFEGICVASQARPCGEVA